MEIFFIYYFYCIYFTFFIYYFYCNEGINPATNSLSASGKSKGTLLNSANIEINRIELSK